MRHVQRDRAFYHLTGSDKVTILVVQLSNLDIVLQVSRRKVSVVELRELRPQGTGKTSQAMKEQSIHTDTEQ